LLQKKFAPSQSRWLAGVITSRLPGRAAALVAKSYFLLFEAFFVAAFFFVDFLAVFLAAIKWLLRVRRPFVRPLVRSWTPERRASGWLRLW
jgi:hypothetical protein